MKSYTRFAWIVVAFHVIVVGWGALVRASGSGAGCGQHWPSCQGQLIPHSPAIETIIEFSHRTTSGLALLTVVALWVWALRAYPSPHPVRRTATAALILVVIEALLGAGLVIFGWVAKDASPERGWVMSLHLFNTFLLLAALTLTAQWSYDSPAHTAAPKHGLGGLFAVAGVTTILVGISGAIAALGDTLYPASSLSAGMQPEFSTPTNLLLQLRALHPLVAVAGGILLIVTASSAKRAYPVPTVRAASTRLVVLVFLQMVLGALDAALQAPTVLQVAHLMLASLCWIALVRLAVSTPVLQTPVLQSRKASVATGRAG